MAAAAGAGDEGRRRCLLLVIDDDAATRATLADLLADHGYRVEVARDGVEGLELYRRLRPDLVLSDVHMPRLRGLDVLRRVRELDPRARVVLVTGYGSVALAVEAMKEGAADFLVKPLDLERLLLTVESLLAA